MNLENFDIALLDLVVDTVCLQTVIPLLIQGVTSILHTKEVHLCLRDLANARIREADSQNMAGSCLVRKKFEFSGLVCSRLGVFNLII